MLSKQFNQAKKMGMKLQADLGGMMSNNLRSPTAAPVEAPLGKYTKIFGEPLDLESTTVPVIIMSSIAFFDKHGVEFEGLFRISGGAGDMKLWMDKLEHGVREFSDDVDNHVVASLVKQYLRDMPLPLIPYEHYNNFIAAAANTPEDTAGLISGLQQCLAALPFICRVILKYLMVFLCRVSKKSDINFMTPSNIAIVFAPNILRPVGNDIFAQMEDSAHANRIFQALIIHNEAIFQDEPDPPELCPPPIPAKPTDLFAPPPIPPKPPVPEYLAANLAESGDQVSVSGPVEAPPKPERPQPKPFMLSDSTGSLPDIPLSPKSNTDTPPSPGAQSRRGPLSKSSGNTNSELNSVISQLSQKNQNAPSTSPPKAVATPPEKAAPSDKTPPSLPSRRERGANGRGRSTRVLRGGLTHSTSAGSGGITRGVRGRGAPGQRGAPPREPGGKPPSRDVPPTPPGGSSAPSEEESNSSSHRVKRPPPPERTGNPSATSSNNTKDAVLSASPPSAGLTKPPERRPIPPSRTNRPPPPPR